MKTEDDRFYRLEYNKRNPEPDAGTGSD